MKQKDELTVYTIAEMAGVSVSTVSKVLNQHRGVNAKTAEKINAILAETGFRPRWKASGSKCIGVVLPPYHGALLDSYDSIILSRCCDDLMDQGYSLQLICRSKIGLNSAGQCILGASDMINGVIAISSPPNYDFCHQLLSETSAFPAVVIGKLKGDRPNTPSKSNHIIADDFSAGYQAAMLLLRHNHKKFMLVAASLEDIVHRHRREGMLDALHSNGISEQDIDTIEFKDGLRESGTQLAVSIACSVKKPDALIFSNGSICAGFVTGCDTMKLRIPDEFSVIGFEDASELLFLPVPVTAMHTPADKIGKCAVDSLLALIERRPLPSPCLIQHNLLMRQSVAMR